MGSRLYDEFLVFAMEIHSSVSVIDENSQIV